MKLESPPPPKDQLAPESATKPKKKPGNQGKRRICFEAEAQHGAQVFVAGSFNNWEPTACQLSDENHPGHFRRNIYVEPGSIEYKFVIDGEWQIDTKCRRWTPNGIGGLNSVIEV